MMAVTTAKSLRVPDSGKARRLHVRVGSCSMQGVRRDNNEDREYIAPTRDLFIVADGVGGHSAGELASKFAIDVVSHDLARIETDRTDAEIEQGVKAALGRAHCMIVDLADDPSRSGAGSTVVLALLRNHRLFIAGVGDSRAYMVRDGELLRLTKDDTWPDTLVEMGRISVDEARNHHMRNYLLSALGMEEYDAAEEEIHIVDVFAGDRFLLASDGVTDNITGRKIERIINQFDNPQEAAEELAYVARGEGGGDDTTAVVFYVSNGGPQTTRPSRNQSWWKRLTSVVRSAS